MGNCSCKPKKSKLYAREARETVAANLIERDRWRHASPASKQTPPHSEPVRILTEDNPDGHIQVDTANGNNNMAKPRWRLKKDDISGKGRRVEMIVKPGFSPEDMASLLRHLPEPARENLLSVPQTLTKKAKLASFEDMSSLSSHILNGTDTDVVVVSSKGKKKRIGNLKSKKRVTFDTREQVDHLLKNGNARHVTEPELKSQIWNRLNQSGQQSKLKSVPKEVREQYDIIFLASTDTPLMHFDRESIVMFFVKDSQKILVVPSSNLQEKQSTNSRLNLEEQHSSFRAKDLQNSHSDFKSSNTSAFVKPIKKPLRSEEGKGSPPVRPARSIWDSERSPYREDRATASEPSQKSTSPSKSPAVKSKLVPSAVKPVLTNGTFINHSTSAPGKHTQDQGHKKPESRTSELAKRFEKSAGENDYNGSDNKLLTQVKSEKQVESKTSLKPPLQQAPQAKPFLPSKLPARSSEPLTSSVQPLKKENPVKEEPPKPLIVYAKVKTFDSVDTSRPADSNKPITEKLPSSVQKPLSDKSTVAPSGDRTGVSERLRGNLKALSKEYLGSSGSSDSITGSETYQSAKGYTSSESLYTAVSGFSSQATSNRGSNSSLGRSSKSSSSSSGSSVSVGPSDLTSSASYHSASEGSFPINYQSSRSAYSESFRKSQNPSVDTLVPQVSFGGSSSSSEVFSDVFGSGSSSSSNSSFSKSCLKPFEKSHSLNRSFSGRAESLDTIHSAPSPDILSEDTSPRDSGSEIPVSKPSRLATDLKQNKSPIPESPHSVSTPNLSYDSKSKLPVKGVVSKLKQSFSGSSNSSCHSIESVSSKGDSSRLKVTFDPKSSSASSVSSANSSSAADIRCKSSESVNKDNQGKPLQEHVDPIDLIEEAKRFSFFDQTIEESDSSESAKHSHKQSLRSNSSSTHSTDKSYRSSLRSTSHKGSLSNSSSHKGSLSNSSSHKGSLSNSSSHKGSLSNSSESATGAGASTKHSGQSIHLKTFSVPSPSTSSVPKKQGEPQKVASLGKSDSLSQASSRSSLSSWSPKDSFDSNSSIHTNSSAAHERSPFGSNLSTAASKSLAGSKSSISSKASGNSKGSSGSAIQALVAKFGQRENSPPVEFGISFSPKSTQQSQQGDHLSRFSKSVGNLNSSKEPSEPLKSPLSKSVRSLDFEKLDKNQSLNTESQKAEDSSQDFEIQHELSSEPDRTLRQSRSVEDQSLNHKTEFQTQFVKPAGETPSANQSNQSISSIKRPGSTQSVSSLKFQIGSSQSLTKSASESRVSEDKRVSNQAKSLSLPSRLHLGAGKTSQRGSPVPNNQSSGIPLIRFKEDFSKNKQDRKGVPVSTSVPKSKPKGSLQDSRESLQSASSKNSTSRISGPSDKSSRSSSNKSSLESIKSAFSSRSGGSPSKRAEDSSSSSTSSGRHISQIKLPSDKKSVTGSNQSIGSSVASISSSSSRGSSHSSIPGSTHSSIPGSTHSSIPGSTRLVFTRDAAKEPSPPRAVYKTSPDFKISTEAVLTPAPSAVTSELPVKSKTSTGVSGRSTAPKVVTSDLPIKVTAPSTQTDLPVKATVPSEPTVKVTADIKTRLTPDNSIELLSESKPSASPKSASVSSSESDLSVKPIQQLSPSKSALSSSESLLSAKSDRFYSLEKGLAGSKSSLSTSSISTRGSSVHLSAVEEPNLSGTEEPTLTGFEDSILSKVLEPTLSRVEDSTLSEFKESILSKVEESTLPKVEELPKVVESTPPKVEELPKVVESTLPKVEELPKVVESTLPKVEESTLPKVEELPKVEQSSFSEKQATRASSESSLKSKASSRPERLPVRPMKTVTGQPPRFIIKPRAQFVRVGDRFSMKCAVEGEPPPTVTWELNKQEVQLSQRIKVNQEGDYWFLNVSDVTMDDRGLYTCIAKNPHGSSSAFTNVDVTEPLKKSSSRSYSRSKHSGVTVPHKELDETSVRSGQTSSSSTKSINVDVNSNETFVKAEPKPVGGSSSLKARLHELSKEYDSADDYTSPWATHSREGSMASSRSTTSDNYQPPTFTKRLSDQTVREGDQVTISCHTGSQSRTGHAPVFTEQLQDHEVSEGDSVTLQVSQGKYRGAGLERQARVNRIINKPNFERRQRIQNILGNTYEDQEPEAPRFVKNLHDANVNEGDSVTIDCKTQPSHNVPQPKAPEFVTDLEDASVEEGTNVTLECHGQPLSRNSTKQVPRFVKKLEDCNVKEGDNVTLECHTPKDTSTPRAQAPQFVKKLTDFGNVSPGDNLTIECRSSSMDESSASLDTSSTPHAQAPQFVKKLSDFGDVSAGDNLTIECKSGTAEDSTRSNVDRNTEKTQAPRFVKELSDFGDVSAGDNLTIECKSGVNEAAPDSKPNRPPMFTLPLTTMVASEGDSLTVGCKNSNFIPEKFSPTRSPKSLKYIQESLSLSSQDKESDSEQTAASSKVSLKAPSPQTKVLPEPKTSKGLTVPSVRKSREPSTGEDQNSLCNEYGSEVSPLSPSDLPDDDRLPMMCDLHTDPFTSEDNPENELPRFVTPLHDLIVEEGGSIQLTVVTAGTQPVEIVWVHNADELQPDHADYAQESHGHTHRLTISDVFPEDAGTYICEAYNTLGECDTACEVTVTGKTLQRQPSILDHLPANLSVMDGQSVCLQCAIEHVDPVDVTWSKNGRMARQGQRFKVGFEEETNTFYYKIEGTLPTDSGLYECTALNDEGSVSTKCQLDVVTEDDKGSTLGYKDVIKQSRADMMKVMNHSKPKVTEGPNNTKAFNGDRVVLSCLIEGEPTPEVKWFHNQRELQRSPNVFISYLTGLAELILPEVKVTDSGQYHVTAVNPMGEDSGSCTVAVDASKPMARVPEAPTGKPFVTDVSSQGMTVAWYGPAYDGGSKVLTYKVEMCKCSLLKISHDKFWKTLTDQCTNTSYRVNNVVAEAEYLFRIRAVNSVGEGTASDWSEPVVATDGRGRLLSDSESLMETESLWSEYSEYPESEYDVDLDEAFSGHIATILPHRKLEEYYTAGEVIGKGKFGTVFLCYQKTTGREWAAKRIKYRNSQRESILNEIDIMNDLSHPKLLRLWDVFETNKEITLITEYVGGGELFERIVDDDIDLTETDCVRFSRQICEGVHYMHTHCILHLDLKPENVICTRKDSNQIKLIDFGLARRFKKGDLMQVMFGTPEFVAPEVISYDAIDFTTDMWSIGVITYILLSGLSPFAGDTDPETLSNVTKAAWDFDDDAFDSISETAKDFVAKLLRKKKEDRLSAEEACSHPWMADSRTGRTKKLKKSKEKMRRFVARRKWQKTGNAIRAINRLGSLFKDSTQHHPHPLLKKGLNDSQPHDSSTAQVTRELERVVLTSDEERSVGADSSENLGQQSLSSTPVSTPPKPIISDLRKSTKGSNTFAQKRDLAESHDSGFEGKRQSSNESVTAVASRSHDRPTTPGSSSYSRGSSSQSLGNEQDGTQGSEGSPERQTEPIFHQEIAEQMVNIGEEARMETEIVNSDGVAVDWFKNGQPLEQNYRISFSQSANKFSLIIKHARTSDDAEYECRAGNNMGESSCFFELFVKPK